MVYKTNIHVEVIKSIKCIYLKPILQLKYEVIDVFNLKLG